MTPTCTNLRWSKRLLILVAAAPLAALLPLPPAARGDGTTQTPPSVPTTSDAKSGVTRADLAAAYQRFEQTYAAHPPTGDKIAEINKAFDLATMQFFAGKNADAIRAIDALSESLGGKKPNTAERAIVSLKAIIDPPVATLKGGLHASCRIASVYAWPENETLELRLRLLDPKGGTVLDQPIALTVGPGVEIDTRVPLEVASGKLVPGLYRVELGPAGGAALQIGRLNVVAGAPLDEQRAANEKRLAAITPANPQMTQALTSCRARNQLLNDHPSDVNSAQFLADLNALARDVSAEIDALAAGRDPYARRQGDYWRVFQAGTREIPLRVHAPAAAASDKPAPLVVVFHGMGGDENMFPEAYGAGVIRQIADQQGVLVASPLTYTFGSDVKTLSALVDMLAQDYAIDRDRVYVLGHSLGAGTTAGLARGHGDVIAAACCIAGGSYQAKPNTPPLLVVSPELDGVVSPKSLQAAVKKATADGAPIELRTMPNYGHTVAVGAILPEAVEWLLKHKRGEGK